MFGLIWNLYVDILAALPMCSYIKLGEWISLLLLYLVDTVITLFSFLHMLSQMQRMNWSVAIFLYRDGTHEPSCQKIGRWKNNILANAVTTEIQQTSASLNLFPSNFHKHFFNPSIRMCNRVGKLRYIFLKAISMLWNASVSIDTKLQKKMWRNEIVRRVWIKRIAFNYFFSLDGNNIFENNFRCTNGVISS